MERIKTLFVLIICLNNGMVKCNIIEELLISVNRIRANMETVMQKVEKMESTIKDTETNVLSIRDEVEINSKQNILILEKFERFKEEVKSVQEEQNENLRNVNLQYPKILEGVISVHQANLKNAEEINQNIGEVVKLTSNHSDIILNEIKVFKDEVFSLEEKSRKQKQSSLIMGQLETLEEEVKSVERTGCKSKQNESSIFRTS